MLDVGIWFLVFVVIVQLYSGAYMPLIRSVTLDPDDMPPRKPQLILTTTGTRKGSATVRRAATRRASVAGRRGGFPHPSPSQVPTGSLETKSQKYQNVQYALTELGPTVTHVNVIAQGTGNADRLGYKMRNTALHIRGQFHIPGTGPQAAVMGYYLVWDKFPNTTLATPTDIFNIDAAAGYDLSNTFPKDKDRFVVLKSYRRKLTASSGAGANIQLVDNFVKLPNYCVTGFTKGNGNGQIAATQSGALLFIPYGKVVVNGTITTMTLDTTKELFFAEA